MECNLQNHKIHNFLKTYNKKINYLFFSILYLLILFINIYKLNLQFFQVSKSGNIINKVLSNIVIFYFSIILKLMMIMIIIKKCKIY